MKKIYSILTTFSLVISFNVLNAKPKITNPISLTSSSHSEQLLKLGLLNKYDMSIFNTIKKGRPKISICHIPPGNPQNAHVIRVSIMALIAHLAHGDSFDLKNCGKDTSESNPEGEIDNTNEGSTGNNVTPTDCGACQR